MKLTCTQSHNDVFVAGKEYDLTLLYDKYWTDETKRHVADLSKFQSHAERFLKLCGKANKFIMEIPTTGYSVSLLITENYFVVNTHRKGRLGGNKYYYFHDLQTGELIPHGRAIMTKVLFKEKILKATAEKFRKIQRDRYTSLKVQPVLF